MELLVASNNMDSSFISYRHQSRVISQLCTIITELAKYSDTHCLVLVEKWVYIRAATRITEHFKNRKRKPNVGKGTGPGTQFSSDHQIKITNLNL